MANHTKYQTLCKLVLLAILFGYGGYYGRIIFNSPIDKLETPTLVPDKSSVISATKAPLTISDNDAVFVSINTPPAPQGIPVMQTRPDWRITGRLSDQISSLKLQFKKGDLAAGYRLAMNLRYCWNSEQNEADFNVRLQTEQNTYASDETIQSLKDKYAKCQGVEQHQQQQFYHFMQLTAERGFVPAQEFYGQLTTEFYMSSQGKTSQPREQYITSKAHFISEKLHFLGQAAEHGSIKSMSKLATLYYSQNYGEHGWIKALAYNKAILALTEDNNLYRRNQWFIEKSSQELSAQEQAQAQAMSVEIIQAVMQNGTLYSAN